MSIIDQVEMCRINRQSGKQRMLSIATTVSLLLSSSSFAYAQSGPTNVVPALSGFSTKVFAQGTSSVTKQDTIATMGGNIFVGCQNGVGSDGAASPFCGPCSRASDAILVSFKSS